MKRLIFSLLFVPLVGCPFGNSDRDPIEGTESFDQFFGNTEEDATSYRRAQDAIVNGDIPKIGDVTVEGALANYQLDDRSNCDQLLCTNSEATVAPSLLEGKDVVWVRDRFTSGVSSTARPGTDVVLAIDTSGLMFDLPQTTEAANAILSGLRDGDRFSVVTFSDRAEVFQPPVEVSSVNRLEVMNRVASLDSGGSHDLNVGLQTSYRVLQELGNDPNRIRRVVLFTCGYPRGTDLSQTFDGTLRASEARIGTTMVGVLLPYDEGIASRYSAIPGANFFAAHDLGALKVFFAEEFAKYAAPVAYDVSFRFAGGADYEFGSVYGNGSGRNGIGFDIATAYPTTRRGAVIARLETDEPNTFKGGTTFDYVPESARGFSERVADRTELDVAIDQPTPQFEKSIALVNMVEMMKEALRLRELGDAAEGKAKLVELTDYLERESERLNDEELRNEAGLIRKLSAQF